MNLSTNASGWPIRFNNSAQKQAKAKDIVQPAFPSAIPALARASVRKPAAIATTIATTIAAVIGSDIGSDNGIALSTWE